MALVPEGRAARRRQRERWRKNQRRAVVATAFALVGGGLAVSTMDRQSGDRAQAATAPENPGLDPLEETAEEPLKEPHDKHVEEQVVPDTLPTSISPPPPAPVSATSGRSELPRQEGAATPPPAPPTVAPPAVTTQPRTTTPPVAPALPPTAAPTEAAPAPPSPPPAAPASPSDVCLPLVCVDLGLGLGLDLG
ncbi:hypothetical protein [Streptomyces sp. NPDC026092]|uniref:hypothetical protein n=1 Tax=Streptomyces sp. NPDC026092 TaxID=3154797 RepID=UPI0034051CE9